MRRLLFMFVAASALCALAACGKKGPLYRPVSTPAAAASTPAPAAAVSAPTTARSG